MSTTIRYNTTTYGTTDLNVHFPTPADEDDIRFVAGGDLLVDSLNQPGIDFAGVRQWVGSNVGMAEGSYLCCDVDNASTGVMEYLGGGPRFNHGGGTGGVVYRTVCAPRGGGTMGIGFATCTYTYDEVYAGKQVVYAAGTPTNFYIGGTGKADIKAGTAITLAEPNGDSYTNCQRAVTTLNLGGRATWVIGGFGKTYVTVTMRGGTLRPDCGGTVSTTFTALDGVIDCSRMTKDFDVSGATVTLGSSLKIIPSTSGAKIIWPAEANIKFRGPKPEGYRQ